METEPLTSSWVENHSESLNALYITTVCFGFGSVLYMGRLEFILLSAKLATLFSFVKTIILPLLRNALSHVGEHRWATKPLI